MAEKEQAAAIAAARSTRQWRSAEEAAALGASGSELEHAYSVLRELAIAHNKEMGTVVGWWGIPPPLTRRALCSTRAPTKPTEAQLRPTSCVASDGRATRRVV